LVKLEWVPKPVRNALGEILRELNYRRQKHALKALNQAKFKRIVIGSSGTRFEGWVSTDRETLDLLDENTWKRFFEQDALDAILAEHVWEHLTPDQAVTAAKTCLIFLKPGGHLRVAVPDGYHPDPSYIESVRPKGTGEGAEDHKVLYNYATFRDLFVNMGYDVRLREYFDESGLFHYEDWSPSDGMIQRSRKYDSRNSNGQLRYTSIVLDAVKPDASALRRHV
jgi:predicted SAM-dependent methyltransferase